MLIVMSNHEALQIKIIFNLIKRKYKNDSCGSDKHIHKLYVRTWIEIIFFPFLIQILTKPISSTERNYTMESFYT